MPHPAQSVIVGVDGSPAATAAACWAVDEAVSRDVPLRLVYVIDEAPARVAEPGPRMAGARAALYVARRAVEASGKPVRIETEILRGKPLARLIEQSRSAAMICVGSVGLRHARDGIGSTSAALAEAALCPVAVIGRPSGRPTTPVTSRVVVHAGNGVAMHHAFAEARLRHVPLRAFATTASGRSADGSERRSAQAQLRRRLEQWARVYPDVTVEPAVIDGDVDRYLDGDAGNQLFVTDSQVRFDVCGAHHAGRSVLAVRPRNL